MDLAEARVGPADRDMGRIIVRVDREVRRRPRDLKVNRDLMVLR